VLDQDGEKPFYRAEKCPVHHVRLVPAIVGPDVLHVETLRELEVDLDGRDLPAPADGVAHVHVDLGA